VDVPLGARRRGGEEEGAGLGQAAGRDEARQGPHAEAGWLTEEVVWW